MDKTAIFYFSATGNSLYVAKSVSRDWPDAQLISIPHKLKEDSMDFRGYKVIGIVTPLYFMGLPPIVEEFLKKADLRDAKYCFSIVTRAYSLGHAFYQINMRLKEKGLELSYAQYLNFPDNYIRWAQGADEKSQHILFEKMRKKLLDYKKQIKEKTDNYNKEGLVLRLSSSAVYHIWKSRLKHNHLQFKVSEVCNACGICEKACLAGNISLSEGKPCWQANCVDCMACVQHCPKKAIYFNKGTAKKRRYRHPEVSLKELLYPIMKED